MWALAVGLFIYALWSIITVILPADVSGDSAMRRIGYLVSAAMYVVLGAYCIVSTPSRKMVASDEDGVAE